VKDAEQVANQHLDQKMLVVDTDAIIDQRQTKILNRVAGSSSLFVHF